MEKCWGGINPMRSRSRKWAWVTAAGIRAETFTAVVGAAGRVGVLLTPEGGDAPQGFTGFECAVGTFVLFFR